MACTEAARASQRRQDRPSSVGTVTTIGPAVVMMRQAIYNRPPQLSARDKTARGFIVRERRSRLSIRRSPRRTHPLVRVTIKRMPTASRTRVVARAKAAGVTV